MKINQTLFFITLALCLTMAQAPKPDNKNTEGFRRYKQRKDAADAIKAQKQAAQPKPETLEEKEETASKRFMTCTRNQFKAAKNTYSGVEKLIAQAGITHFPQDFSAIPFEDCYLSTSQGVADGKDGIHTFRLAYKSGASNRIVYFPIVTSKFGNYELEASRTLSAQKNTALTHLGQAESPIPQEEEVFEEENNNEDAAHDSSNHIKTDSHEPTVNHNEPTADNNEPTADSMAELEKMAILADKKDYTYSLDEHNHLSKHAAPEPINHKNLADMAELEKMAIVADKDDYMYTLDEENHLSKHSVPSTKPQTNNENDEDIFANLYNTHNDIKDHVEKSATEDESTKKHTLPLLGGEHDVKLLEPVKAEPEEEKSTVTSVGELDYDVPNKPHENTTADEKSSTDGHEFGSSDLFSNKSKNHNKQRNVKNLDDQTTDDNEDTTPSVQPAGHYSNSKYAPLVGGWSKPQVCSEEEKKNTIAYAIKMTSTGKILGFLPTLQNIVSCSHQIVAGTNFSVIIQINNDICEVVYNIDLQNIVHDLNKSYIKREVPCVDMYARHLF